jgi:uncharacterized protein YgiM (DUF1202 family)
MGGNIMRFLFIIILFAAYMVAPLQASELGEYYVTAPVLNERTAPETGEIVNRIYKGQKVTVYSVKGEWARISSFDYEPRWVSMKYLLREEPELQKAKEIPESLKDPRIAKGAIPKAGQYGLTEKDVEILWKGANLMLKKGRCSQVEYADKSTKKANTYYVNCGSQNIFFTEADLYE